MLKLLESPYDPVLELSGSEECIVDKPLEHKEESQTVTEKKESLDSAATELMSHYLSKPPEWSLSLCVT